MDDANIDERDLWLRRDVAVHRSGCKLALIIGLLAAGACGSDPICAPGATQPCVCSGSAAGAQSCRDDKEGWEPCVCSAATTTETTSAVPTSAAAQYAEGRRLEATGHEADLRRSLALFRKAAQQRDTEAQFHLGEIYELAAAGDRDKLRDAGQWYLAVLRARNSPRDADARAAIARMDFTLPSDVAEPPLDDLGERAAPGAERSAIKAHPHSAEAAKPPHKAEDANILGILKASEAKWEAATAKEAAAKYGADTALGNDPMSALGALMGDEIGGDFGFGGEGFRGTGRGGGGTGEGTIGLGNIGTVGEGATADGATADGYGGGPVGFTGKAKKVPPIRWKENTPAVSPAAPIVPTSLSKVAIHAVFVKRIRMVRACYENELSRRPDLSGTVVVEIVVDPVGKVSSVSIPNSTIGDARVESCILKTAQRWKFPVSQKGGRADYSFVLGQE